MQEAKNPRVRGATSRVTTTVIVVHQFDYAINHFRDDLLLSESASRQPPDMPFERDVSIFVMLAHRLKCDRDGHFGPVQVRNVQTKGNRRILVNKAQGRQRSGCGYGNNSRGFDGRGRVVNGLVRGVGDVRFCRS